MELERFMRQLLNPRQTMNTEPTEAGMAKVVAEGKIMDHMDLKEKKRSVLHSESLVNAGMVNIAK